MSMNLESMNNGVFRVWEMMGLSTHDFDILQSVSCCRYGISLRIDMGHVAPILDGICGGTRRNIDVGEDEAKDVTAIDDSIEVTDLGFVWWIPRAIEASALLLHTWDSRERDFCERPVKGKVSQVEYGPESNEE